MILHILKREEWDDALRRGSYQPPSLAAEGFIHCSTTEQAVDTANHFFQGQTDLIILRIDEARLTSALKYEPPSMPGHAAAGMFPHIYGPLNPDAVTEVHEFPMRRGGKVPVTRPAQTPIVRLSQ